MLKISSNNFFSRFFHVEEGQIKGIAAEIWEGLKVVGRWARDEPLGPSRLYEEERIMERKWLESSGRSIESDHIHRK